MYGDGRLHWEARVAGSKSAEDHGHYGGIKFGSVFVYSIQQVSSAMDQRGNEPLLPRVDVLSLVPLPATLVSGPV